MTDAIALRGVGRTFPGKRPVAALDGIDLTVRAGEFVTLFGPSGSGKSTLLRIMAGLERADAGTVEVLGGTPHEAARRKDIGWVPQNAALLPWSRVRANAGLSALVNRRADRAPHPQRVPQDVDGMLAEVGLADFADARPGQLSGGMQQRAALARVFVQGAPLLLMDEPFSALDEITRSVVRLQLLDLWERHRKTVVFVTHSAEEAALLSDRVIVLSSRPGRIAAEIAVPIPRPRADCAADSDEVRAVEREITAALRAGASG
jgi:NitT/TauT family transport system ATP-binding protein